MNVLSWQLMYMISETLKIRVWSIFVQVKRLEIIQLVFQKDIIWKMLALLANIMIIVRGGAYVKTNE